MTLIVVCCIVGAALGAVVPLYLHVATKRAAAREQARHDLILDEQAALHREIADKLIPRFAKDGAPEGDGPM